MIVQKQALEHRLQRLSVAVLAQADKKDRKNMHNTVNREIAKLDQKIEGLCTGKREVVGKPRQVSRGKSKQRPRNLESKMIWQDKPS